MKRCTILFTCIFSIITPLLHASSEEHDTSSLRLTNTSLESDKVDMLILIVRQEKLQELLSSPTPPSKKDLASLPEKLQLAYAFQVSKRDQTTLSGPPRPSLDAISIQGAQPSSRKGTAYLKGTESGEGDLPSGHGSRVFSEGQKVTPKSFWDARKKKIDQDLDDGAGDHKDEPKEAKKKVVVKSHTKSPQTHRRRKNNDTHTPSASSRQTKRSQQESEKEESKKEQLVLRPKNSTKGKTKKEFDQLLSELGPDQ